MAAGTVIDSAPRDQLARLEAAAEAVQRRSVDELDDALAAELQTVGSIIRRLSAWQSRLACVRSARTAARARDAAKEAGRPGGLAEQRATRRVRRELGSEMGWSPAETKRAVELGRRLDPAAPAGRAFDRGQLPTRHVAVLADTLRWIDGIDRRRDAEATLVALAATQDPVTFGRSCRQLLAELEPEGAEEAAIRRRVRRSGSVWQTEDGMTGVSARLSGVDGELFTTAFHAFRRPDAPGERRRAEQAGADALVAMARAALDAGEAARHHGVRPHITVQLPWQTIANGAGVPQGVWTGPLPYHEVPRLLADRGVSRLLTDAAGVALEAGEAVRTVPAGLARAVEAR